MSLAAVKSQLSAIERRLDSIEGKNRATEYVWSVVDADGVRTILSGDPASQARSVVEIQVVDLDGPGSSPRIIVDGRERDLSTIECLEPEGFSE